MPSRVQGPPGGNPMNMDHVLFPVNGIENAPFPDGVLNHIRQIRMERFMPKVGNIGGQPFGFIQETLGHALVSGLKIVKNRRHIGDTIPGHMLLPVKTQSFRDCFPGYPVR